MEKITDMVASTLTASGAPVAPLMPTTIRFMTNLYLPANAGLTLAFVSRLVMLFPGFNLQAWVVD
jgi:hypothetical protein